MTYNKIFDPPLIQSLDKDISATDTPESFGDRRERRVYVYTEKIILAVNVAIATTRPLLIRGPSGSGKSSLAHNVADHMRWRYYDEVISSRTQARDLLWSFDALRRLRDAQVQELRQGLQSYVEPGKLWWAFNRDTAMRRGYPPEATNFDKAIEPGDGTNYERVVVLLDEIDKADPDVPNDLLVPLGSGQFKVQETGFVVEALHPPLVLITTNEERVLPDAFLRRCVVLVLEPPDENRLVDIAKTHFGSDHLDIYQSIAKQFIELRKTLYVKCPETRRKTERGRNEATRPEGAAGEE
jgi:MoxR-like ATPase